MRRSCDTDSGDDDDYQALSGVSQVVVYHSGPDTTTWNSGSL
jgi:proteasome lid subunit RPN8/RPN11